MKTISDACKFDLKHRPARRGLGFARSIRNVYRRHGLIETVNLGLQELFFDLYNGSSTALDPRIGYESSNPLLFRRLFDRLPQELDMVHSWIMAPARDEKVLMLAAQEGFTRVLGVDLSSNLCAIARQNAAIHAVHYPRCSIAIQNGDAAEMTVPADVTVAYLYNPFGPETVRAVIGRLDLQYRCGKRHDAALGGLYGAFAR